MLDSAAAMDAASVSGYRRGAGESRTGTGRDSESRKAGGRLAARYDTVRRSELGASDRADFTWGTPAPWHYYTNTDSVLSSFQRIAFRLPKMAIFSW